MEVAHTLFISDCHLEKTRPHIIRRFQTFLTEQAPQADALYILGDLFDYWIGDDDGIIRFSDSIKALRKLSRQTHIYFMHGNRDFLIGKEFARQANCTLLKQPKAIDLYGQRTLILHGDMLCTQDRAYHRYRRIVQNPVTKWLHQKLSIKMRLKIAQQLRNISKETVQNTPPSIMDVHSATVIAYFQRYNVNQMIHGHTHRPATHTVNLNDQMAQRIVLGDWYQRGSYLRVEKNGLRLANLPA